MYILWGTIIRRLYTGFRYSIDRLQYSSTGRFNGKIADNDHVSYPEHATNGLEGEGGDINRHIHEKDGGSTNKHKLRFGIISETGSNSSPLLCFSHILQGMLERYRDIELIYFCREEDRNSKLYYELLLRTLAKEVYFVSSGDLLVSMNVLLRWL